MLMSLPELVAKYAMDITGVLHLGAHLAEEAPVYRGLGIDTVVWVEANPAVMPKLTEILAGYDHVLIQALIYSEEDVELGFNVTNYDGMSSSILDFGTHPEFSPDTVFVDRIVAKTTTVDRLRVPASHRGLNFLNMDLQGAELHALKGATNFLAEVDYIMTEVNNAEVYVGCARIEQLDEHLADFDRVETYWVPGQGWGDALYIRRSIR